MQELDLQISLGSHGTLSEDDIPLAKAAWHFLKDFLKDHFHPAKPAKQPQIAKKQKIAFTTTPWEWIKLTDGLQLCDGVLCPVSVQWISKGIEQWSSTSQRRIKKVKENKKAMEVCSVPQHLTEFMRNCHDQIKTNIIRWISDFFRTPTEKRSSVNPAFSAHGSRNVQLPGSGASGFAAPAPSGSGSIPAPFPPRQFTGKFSCVQNAYNNARFTLGNVPPLRLEGREFICLHDFAQWVKRQDIGLHRLQRIRSKGYNRGLFNCMQPPNRYIVIVLQHCIAIDLSNQGFVYESHPATMFDFGIPFRPLKKDCSNFEELTNYYKKVLKMDLLKHIKQVWKVIV